MTTPSPDAIEAAAVAIHRATWENDGTTLEEEPTAMQEHFGTVATAALAAAYPLMEANAKAGEPAPVGYIIVDIKTRELDWDGTLQSTKEAAIDSLTNPRQSYCRTPAEETEERTYYGAVYEILPVIEGKDS